jgi:hypothetical protein
VTLIIATCSPAAVTITADTRLSSNGRLVDDKSAKVGCATFFDARLLYAYTGLAKAGRYETRKWLLEALLESTKEWSKAEEVIRSFKAKATQDFGNLPALKRLTPFQKRVSFVSAGFVGDQPVAAIVSNFENLAENRFYAEAQDQFWFSGWPGREGEKIWISCFGTIAAVSDRDILSLKVLVETNKPVDAIKGKSEAIIVGASKDPRSNGTVGTNMLRASLRPDVNEPPTGGFTSETGGHEMLMLDQFHHRGPAILGATLSADGAVPPRHRLRRKRNRQKR